MELEPVLHQVTSLEATSIQERNDIEKNQTENSSIFHQFLKLNRCQFIYAESMSFFPSQFSFYNR